MSNILPQAQCSAKLAFRLQRGSEKGAKSAIFGIFFDFSNVNAKLFILEEKKFVDVNLDLIETHLFHHS